MKHRETRQRRKYADEDVAALRLDRLDDRCGLQFQGLELLAILRRGHNPQPRKQRHDIDRESDEERIAPAPIVKVLRRQIRDEISEEATRHDQPERCAELRNHRVPAALLFWRVNGEQRRQTIPNAAERHALADAQDRQNECRNPADLRITRQKAERNGGGAHEKKCGCQFHAAAPGPFD